MSSDVAHRPDELVLYLTGDAGWRGKDKDVYTRLQQWGYAVAGVSAPDYLKSLPGEAGTTTPSRLAADFAHIIEVARDALALPGDLPVVLVGVSRGADLAVVAAILSSNEDIPIEQGVCFAGEVGLSGEIRPVNRIDHRIQEAEKLGFSTIFVSKYNKISLKSTAIQVKLVSKIEDIASELFG